MRLGLNQLQAAVLLVSSTNRIGPAAAAIHHTVIHVHVRMPCL